MKQKYSKAVLSNIAAYSQQQRMLAAPDPRLIDAAFCLLPPVSAAHRA
jgi:hypothetical protein